MRVVGQVCGSITTLLVVVYIYNIMYVPTVLFPTDLLFCILVLCCKESVVINILVSDTHTSFSVELRGQCLQPRWQPSKP